MLRFVEPENFRSDRNSQHIIMEFDGFVIPPIEDYPELVNFNVKTYSTFFKHTSSIAYRPVNSFLETLTLDEQHEIASAFVEMNSVIKNIALDMNDIDAIVDHCAETINELDTNIDLCPKLDRFTQRCVDEGIFPMADMSAAGSGPHHRKDMTFHKDEAIITISMATLSKLLSPIIGEFIYRHTAFLGDFKETKIASIFTTIYERRYKTISKKLNLYIDNLVDTKAKSDPAIHLAGVTSDSTTMKVESSLKTKKFPMVDCYQEDSSIIKYIASCIRSFIDNQLTSNQNSGNAKMHTDPKDENAVASNEETNFSRMEKQSRSSKSPLSKEPLAMGLAEDVIKWLVKDGLLDPKKYEESLTWYNENPMIITNIGLFLAVTYFGKDMGGGKTLYVLDKPYLFRLLVALQLIMIDKGYLYLAHGCTMTESRENKEVTPQDAVFSTMWKSTAAYTLCKRAMSGGYGDVQWDIGIKTIVQAFLTKNYTTHMCPHLSDHFNQLNTVSNNNGECITSLVEFMEELMLFIHEMWALSNTINT